ncbi:hypothetical protein D3C72_2087440 [compost metagenome]
MQQTILQRIGIVPGVSESRYGNQQQSEGQGVFHGDAPYQESVLCHTYKEMVAMRMAMRRALVGTGFRLERRLLHRHLQTEAANHLVQYVVMLIA